MTTVAATVNPVNRDEIKISVAVGYEAVIFHKADGGAEVCITDRAGAETTRLGVAPPEQGKSLHISRSEDRRTVTVRYMEIKR